MSKWTIEMGYATIVTVCGVEADTVDEAIEKAKELVEENRQKYIDSDELQFDYVAFTNKEGK